MKGHYEKAYKNIKMRTVRYWMREDLTDTYPSLLLSLQLQFTGESFHFNF